MKEVVAFITMFFFLFLVDTLLFCGLWIICIGIMETITYLPFITLDWIILSGIIIGVVSLLVAAIKTIGDMKED